jgi:hypothetical protein
MNVKNNGSDLDRLLEAKDDYLEDAGFTDRVLAAMPPRRNRGRLRVLILTSSTLVSCLFVLFVWPGLEPIRDVLQAILTYQPAFIPFPLPVVPVAAALAVLWGGIWVAVRE